MYKNITNTCMFVETYPKYFVLFNGFECLLHSIKMQLFLIMIYSHFFIVCFC